VGDAVDVAARSLDDRVHLARFDADGGLLWSVEDPASVATGKVRAFVRCSSDASCLFGTDRSAAAEQAVLRARAESGEPSWSGQRAGVATVRNTFAGDMIEAPGGGVVLLGTTVTETGGQDLILHRVDADGRVVWATVVDGGGTSDSLPFPRGLDVDEAGRILVTGVSRGEDDDVQALVAQLSPEGEPVWVKALDLDPAADTFPRGVLADVGNRAVVALNTSAPGMPSRAHLTRLDDAGNEVWARILDGSGLVVGIEPVPGGYAVVTTAGTLPDFIRVTRFSRDGAFLRSDATAGSGGCEVAFGFQARADSDAQGTVHVIAPQRNGPEACARPTLFRFDAEAGLASASSMGVANDFGSIGLAMRAEGGTAAYFYQPDGSGVALADELGVLMEIITPALPTTYLEDVAVGPAVGAVAYGYRLADDRSSAPVLFAFDSEQGSRGVDLPSYDGHGVASGNVIVDPSGTVYASYASSDVEISVSQVSRVDGVIRVAAEDANPGRAPLLVGRGPNPIRAGAPLRLAVGASADLALYDVLGRRVAVWNAVPPGDFEAALPARLAAGLYVLRAEGEDTAATLRVTVLR
ncbi:MAG: hypothetical protein AAGG50_09240, partial [Bacteroidota bacterium]